MTSRMMAPSVAETMTPTMPGISHNPSEGNSQPPMKAPITPTTMFPMSSEPVALHDGAGEPAGDGSYDE